jgi:hypothetical protein
MLKLEPPIVLINRRAATGVQAFDKRKREI